MANYVFNSSSSGDTYNAKCLNVSDDSEWTPSVAEYPQDGTIDLSGGTSGRYLDTQWTAPQNTEWTMSGIYNVVMGVSYDMYSIHYKGNQTCDIYLGSNTVPLALSESDKDYTPPTGTWKIYEEPPSIILPADGIVSSKDPFGDGSLIGKWQFDNNTNDTLGLNDGTPTDITYEPGKFEQRAIFNGTSSGVATTLEQTNVTFTLNAVINVSNTDSRAIAATGAATGTAKGFIVQTRLNRIRLGNSNGVTSEFIQFAPWIDLDTDIVIGFTWDGTTNADSAKLYINGVFSDSQTPTIPLVAGNQATPLMIGRHETGGYFAGSLDQVEFYNRVCDAAEMDDLYTQRIV